MDRDGLIWPWPECRKGQDESRRNCRNLRCALPETALQACYVNLGCFRQVEQLLGRRPATLRIAPASLAQEFAPESASPGVDPLNAASVWFPDNPRKSEPRPRRQHVLGRVPTKVKA